MGVTQYADLLVAQPRSDRTVAHQVIVTQPVIFMEQQRSHGVVRFAVRGNHSLQQIFGGGIKQKAA
ncbi:hypothetical protein D3C79_976160 [compost metagenome]